MKHTFNTGEGRLGKFDITQLMAACPRRQCLNIHDLTSAKYQTPTLQKQSHNRPLISITSNVKGDIVTT